LHDHVSGLFILYDLSLNIMFHIVIRLKVFLDLFCHIYLSEGHPVAPVHCSL